MVTALLLSIAVSATPAPGLRCLPQPGWLEWGPLAGGARGDPPGRGPADRADVGRGGRAR